MTNSKLGTREDYVTKYLAFTHGSEVPAVFNRWSALTGIGAWAKQDVWLPFGSGRIYPNMYTMLVGSSGVRKSTSIKGFKRVMEAAGYSFFAGEKTSKEQFLHDLSEIHREEETASEALSNILFSSLDADNSSTVTPCLIAADEFQDFFANNTMEFISMLGVLWDKEGNYDSRARTGSIVIPNPNISMLTGNTVDTLNNTFPPEALGQGFFSRNLFIFGKPNGTKVAFPPVARAEDIEVQAQGLVDMKPLLRGEMQYGLQAQESLEYIYMNWKGVDDERFGSYASRRFIHLLKLCMVQALADYSPTIELHHVVRANTVLTAAEWDMPNALGEYGRSRTAAAAQKMVEYLEAHPRGAVWKDIFTAVRTVVDKASEAASIIRDLELAGKVILSEGVFLIARKVQVESDSALFDWDYLTNEERQNSRPEA